MAEWLGLVLTGVKQPSNIMSLSLERKCKSIMKLWKSVSPNNEVKSLMSSILHVGACHSEEEIRPGFQSVGES